MFLFSGVFGCLPMLLAAKCGLQADHPPTQRSKRKWKNVILAFLLNFGGGILSANAFCHWLPENVEGKVIKTFATKSRIKYLDKHFILIFVVNMKS